MKTYTISAQTVFSAVRHQWKRILVIVLIFAVLGAGGGFLFANAGSSEVGGGGAKALPKVDIETVVRSPAYFNDCLEELIGCHKMLDCYLGLSSIVNTLPTEQVEPLLERLDVLNKEKYIFQQIILAPLQNTLEKRSAFYIPEEFLDDIADRYESRLASIEIELLSAEVAAETVRQMGVPGYFGEVGYDGSSVVINTYANLLMEAANYGDLLKSQAVLEEALRLLRDEPEQMYSESRRMEKELNEAAGELNTLLEEASKLANDIGKAANLIFSVEFGEETSSYRLAAMHTYRAVSLVESFAAIELFCVLVGIFVGAFFAVCREAKEEKKNAGKSA